MYYVFHLCNRIEPYAALFWALGIALAHIRTETVDPARRPSIPQHWYWHGTGQQGLVRFNLRVKTRQFLAFPILLYITYLWFYAYRSQF